jgi:hypothetical protein
VRSALILVFACAAVAADNTALVDRVGTTGFVQLEAASFKKLPLKEQTLAYWLSQASIAIDPINYDQNSIWGLRQKRLLEAIVTHAAAANPKIVAFTKLFWANRGNHQRNDGAEVSAGVYVRGIEDGGGRRRWPAGVSRARRTASHPFAARRIWIENWRRCGPRCSTPNFEPTITAKSPQGSLDILQASANNFYSRRQPGGLEELSRPASAEFAAGEERCGQAGGRDLPRRDSGRQDSGGALRAIYLKKANEYLEKARAVCRAGAGPRPSPR